MQTKQHPQKPASITLGESEFVEHTQLAEMLHISTRTLHRWINSGNGPRRTVVGRKILFRLSTVKDWLEAREEKRGRRRELA